MILTRLRHACVMWLCGMVLVSVGHAHAFDAELLKVRLTPKDDASADPGLLEVSRNFWQSDLDQEEGQRRDSYRATRRYVTENLQSWAKGTSLETLEQVRHTDISLGSQSDDENPALDVKLRVSERMRLRVATADFQRDLLYDPLSERMWLDLYRFNIPNSRAGLTLTNTYELDEADNSLLLKFRYSLQ